ncbi:MAG: hypothetical protein ACI30J_08955 [Paludibacteraceae bacterium]
METICTLIPRKEGTKLLKFVFDRIDKHPKFIVLVSIKTDSGTVVARNAPIAGFITEDDAKCFISKKKEVADIARTRDYFHNKTLFMSYRYRIIPADKYTPNMTKYE